MELLIARNPDPDSSLPYLIRVPVGEHGRVFRTKGTWPRTSALFCYPVSLEEWPDEPDVVERIPLVACTPRGAAIDVIAARTRESRSQIVFTRARGRTMVFWQSPRTRKQARPNVATPTARAAGVTRLQIIVDAHEQYAYRFPTQQVELVKRALPCGDYGVLIDDRLIAAVERKSLADLVSSLTNGRLRFALGELAALPRAAVVVEDRYSQVFALERIRPAVVADALAELQVRYPEVPIVFGENRKLAEEWTYRYLAAALTWVGAEDATQGRVLAPPARTPTRSAEIRAWARAHGFEVAATGRLRPEVRQAWTDAQAAPD
ncbi:MAG: ERCC4 domain-containing protein [Sporichthyaceae bacterium]